MDVKTIVAANASPMTLDGTRTFIIGRERVAIIDPGPLLANHQDAVADAVGDGVVVSILVTHAHPDHAEGAAALAARLHAQVRAHSTGTLRNDDVIETDTGALRALATPGHTPDHFSFWLEAERAVFCGDLMMGGIDTALVARPEGDLADYLASLALLRALRPRVIYPAHGAAFNDADTAIDRYVRHREERLSQVRRALSDGAVSNDVIMDRVYGDSIDPRLRAYAADALQAYIDYLSEA